jgi:hypothetical protein
VDSVFVSRTSLKFFFYDLKSAMFFLQELNLAFSALLLGIYFGFVYQVRVEPLYRDREKKGIF